MKNELNGRMDGYMNGETSNRNLPKCWGELIFKVEYMSS